MARNRYAISLELDSGISILHVEIRLVLVVCLVFLQIVYLLTMEMDEG
jgi:hypothetical protein